MANVVSPHSTVNPAKIDASPAGNVKAQCIVKYRAPIKGFSPILGHTFSGLVRLGTKLSYQGFKFSLLFFPELPKNPLTPYSETPYNSVYEKDNNPDQRRTTS